MKGEYPRSLLQGESVFSVFSAGERRHDPRTTVLSDGVKSPRKPLSILQGETLTTVNFWPPVSHMMTVSSSCAVVIRAVALLGMISTTSAFSAGLAPVIPTPSAVRHACSAVSAPRLLPLHGPEPRARSAKIIVMAAKKKVITLALIRFCIPIPNAQCSMFCCSDANSPDRG